MYVIIICIIIISFLIVEKLNDCFGHLTLQKNVQSLQSSVDSLQKEKEELVLALQSAKKDTNQAKYEHLDFLPVEVLVKYKVKVCFDVQSHKLFFSTVIHYLLLG